MVIQGHDSLFHICHDCANFNYIGKLRLAISLYILEWNYLQVLVMCSLLFFFLNIYIYSATFVFIDWLVRCIDVPQTSIQNSPGVNNLLLIKAADLI